MHLSRILLSVQRTVPILQSAGPPVGGLFMYYHTPTQNLQRLPRPTFTVSTTPCALWRSRDLVYNLHRIMICTDEYYSRLELERGLSAEFSVRKFVDRSSCL